MGFSLAGGFGCSGAGMVQRGLSPRQIARMLTAPNGLHHLIQLGDSRWTGLTSPLLTNANEIAWGGVELPYVNPLASAPAGAHTAGTALAASFGDTPVALSGLSGYVGEVSPASVFITTFSGGAEPVIGNALATRMWSESGLVSLAADPLLWAIFDASGQDKKLRTIVRRLANGTLTDWRACFHGSGTAYASPGSFISSLVASSQGEGNFVVEATIPSSHIWANYGSPRVEYTAEPGEATVNGAKLLISNAGWLEQETGVVLHMHGIGGKSIDGFLDPQVMAPSLFSDYYPLMGESLIYWIDLGTNNPQSNTREEHAEKIRELIDRARAGSENAPIILTTAYASQTSGADPYYRQAARDVAASTPGVLLLDTYGALPTYAAGSALGYYSDTTHYNATGNAALTNAFGTLVAAAAA